MKFTINQSDFDLKEVLAWFKECRGPFTEFPNSKGFCGRGWNIEESFEIIDTSYRTIKITCDWYVTIKDEELATEFALRFL